MVKRPDSVVTLQTIADQAGVHPSTVSRSLQPRPDERRVSPQAMRIRRIAAELGYVPDRNAAALRTARSSTIGVLVPRLTDIVLAEMYDAIEEEASRSGLDTFVANTHDDPAEQLLRVRSLIARRVNGLILGDAHVDGTGLEQIKAFNVPLVLVNRRSDGYPSSTCDDHLGGHMVGMHLGQLGHTDVGIVAGEMHASTALDRVNGCRQGLRELGIEVPAQRVVQTGFDVEGGRRGATMLLDSRRPPTAIFATNDFAAIGVLGVLRDRGLRVGHDIAVVGFNDIPLCRDLQVPLTSVRSPHTLIGRTAVDMLKKIQNGDECHSIRHAPEFMARESSNPAAVTFIGKPRSPRR
jgi:LacI family transcriptional regulator